jgi:ribulose-5-phosphate 4-epimerase/fuculose-1-phosphate aldolase
VRTRLEELKAAADDARDDTWDAAWYADHALWGDAAWDAYEAAEAAEDAARNAYQAELMKIQKENSND